MSEQIPGVSNTKPTKMTDVTKRQRTQIPRASACLLLLALLGGLLAGCHSAPGTPPSLPDYVPGFGIGMDNGLSPAHNYAGEALAYMLQVVVGHAGDPAQRKHWRTTGMDVPLDFRLISRMMTDPQYRKSDLMVLDTNLSGLADIIYHYNPRLNQFKGRYVFDSPYPSSELIGIRLLMIKKLNNAEKVCFSALQKRETLLHIGAPPPTAADLNAMNLDAREFQLIKDIFNSEPIFFKYYKHPFIVAAMTATGFYRKEKITEEMVRKASYQSYAAAKTPSTDLRPQIKVALLPSLIKEFHFGDVYEEPYAYGFKPTTELIQALNDIHAVILNQTEGIIRSEWQRMHPERPIDSAWWHRFWQQQVRPRIHIQSYPQRPLTIHPENAARVIHDICPDADLAVILLGKDVERSMHLHGKNGLTATGRIFIDYTDTPYLSGAEDIQRIARYIADYLSPMS